MHAWMYSHTHARTHTQVVEVVYLVQCSHSLGELGLYLRQRLGPLQGLLQLLLGIV